MMKYFAFWHDCKIVLNEGVLTSRYLKINRGHFWWIWMLMVSLFYRFADMIIVPSRAVKRDLIELFKIPNQKVTIIPNWTLFSKTNAHQSRKYDLAYIGRYEEEKNPMLFLEVVRLVHLQNSKLKACIVGSGKLEPQIKEFIRRHSLSKVVKLLSPLNNMSQVLPSCRLLLVTSKNEGLPNVVLEAGALEIPSIAAPFLGVEEVILEGETGWIRQEASEISSLVLTLLKNNKLITQTGHQAQQHIAKHFSHLNQKKFIQHLVT
jgi:glycosyltransferase involved in cell wall biosynthesis